MRQGQPSSARWVAAAARRLNDVGYHGRKSSEDHTQPDAFAHRVRLRHLYSQCSQNHACNINLAVRDPGKRCVRKCASSLACVSERFQSSCVGARNPCAASNKVCQVLDHRAVCICVGDCVEESRPTVACLNYQSHNHCENSICPERKTGRATSKSTKLSANYVQPALWSIHNTDAFKVLTIGGIIKNNSGQLFIFIKTPKYFSWPSSSFIFEIFNLLIASNRRLCSASQNPH